MNSKDLIDRLALAPHPEGGYYREIYRSSGTVERTDGDKRSTRSSLTTIYFLLERGQQSRWHVVASDEVWHFYDGAPLELISFDPRSASDPKGGRLTRAILGSVASGQGHQQVAVVPAGFWQAARPLGAYSLTGCTVGPGFEFDDFQFVVDVADHERVFKHALSEFGSLL